MGSSSLDWFLLILTVSCFILHSEKSAPAKKMLAKNSKVLLLSSSSEDEVDLVSEDGGKPKESMRELKDEVRDRPRVGQGKWILSLKVRENEFCHNFIVKEN